MLKRLTNENHVAGNNVYKTLGLFNTKQQKWHKCELFLTDKSFSNAVEEILILSTGSLNKNIFRKGIDNVVGRSSHGDKSALRWFR